MKKNYIAPQTKTVKVMNTVALLTNSTNYLRGEASSETVGLSREGRDNSWDDEE